MLAGLIGLFMLCPQTSRADAEQVLMQCSQTSTDENEIVECLAVSLAQVELALVNIEASWQRLLALDVENAGIGSVFSDSDSSGANDSNNSIKESRSDESGSTVIDIVNDTAIQSGLSSQAGITFNVDSDGDTADQRTGSTRLGKVEIQDRFSFLPALFRSYRDQHCKVEAGLFATDRVEVYRQACLIDQTQMRAQQLNTWLAKRRALANGGRSYRGYYVKTNNGALFQSCDRKVDWWVTGRDAVMASLDRRYTDISNRGASSSDVALLYAELRGTVKNAPQVGAGADYSAMLEVENINLLRPVLKTDCVNSKVIAGAQLVAPEQALESYESTAATVDDYASAGFQYGYFNFWVSACSVTESTVCSTETDAQFASDGDWQLRLDRSLESDWRIQLISTTDNQVIERKLKMQIDGSAVFLGNSMQEPLILPMRQGVDITTGELARELIVKLRAGTEVRFEWLDESEVMSELKFSLLGVTRALEFFDQ